MNENSERSDDLNVLPPTDASQTMAGAPRESAMREERARADSMLRATPDPQYQTTPQGMVSAETSAERSCQVIVSGYELLEEIGRGGMGVVFRARNLGLMRDVAVKLLQDRFPINGTAAERFLEEARITGQLQHPGIPPVHQVGRLDGGRPYLAMKLIKGRSLAELIEKKANINVLGIFEQIAQTLAYAHANRVIHRDLKPANVMVGAFNEVQVMDWGLAKVLDRPDSAAEEYDVKVVRLSGQGESDLETKAGSFLGTPAFMPPEQARGEFENVGPHSDVFGLGAILCMMLTGKPPFKGMDANSTRMLAGEGKLDEAYDRLAKCDADPEIVALCRKCLAFKPEDRPATGSEVAVAIAALRAESEDRARQAEVDKAKAEVQAAEERKRQRVKQRLGLAVLAAVIFGGGVALWQMKEAISARNKTQKALDDLALEQKRLLDQRGKTIGALNAMTDDIIEHLFGKQANLEPREKEFLRKVIALYEQATSDQEDTIEAKNLKAEGRYRVGTLYHKLSDYKAAENTLLEARTQTKALYDAQPANVDFRKRMAITQSLLGYIYEKTGRPVLALKEYGDAGELLEFLALDHPKNISYRVGLAATHKNLANLYRSQNRPLEAEKAFVEARDLRKKNAADAPDNPVHHSELADSHDALGVFYVDTNRPLLAEAEYTAARQILQKLAKEHPGDGTHAYALAKVHNNFGNLYKIRNKADLAEPEYAAARDTMAMLADKFPGKPGFRHDLGLIRTNLGVFRRDANRDAEAKIELQAAVDLLTQLVASNGDVNDYRSALGNALVELAALKRKLKSLDEAQQHLSDAVPHHETALKSDAKNPTYLRAMRNHKWESAELALAQNDRTTVLPLVEAMVNVTPEISGTYVLAARIVARASVQATDADDKEKLAVIAVEYLKKAAAKGFKAVKELDADPQLASLKSRPDYKAVIAAMSGMK